MSISVEYLFGHERTCVQYTPLSNVNQVAKLFQLISRNGEIYNSVLIEFSSGALDLINKRTLIMCTEWHEKCMKVHGARFYAYFNCSFPERLAEQHKRG